MEITDGENNVYTVDLKKGPIGSGATANVYKGESQSQRPVAIKIVHSGTGRDELFLFNYEARLLKELKETDHVPELLHWEKDKLIVLEFISAESELQRQGGTTRLLPSDIAIASAKQYVELLVAMHGKQIFTMGDRKATDLRWIQGSERTKARLVVLDWNRARKIESNNQPFIYQDIKIFGRLWAEFLLGRNYTGVDDINNALTIGRVMKVILRNSLESSSSSGYQSASDIAEDIKYYENEKNKQFNELKKQFDELKDDYNKKKEEATFRKLEILFGLMEEKESNDSTLTDLKTSFKALTLEPTIEKIDQLISGIKVDFENEYGFYQRFLMQSNELLKNVHFSIADHLDDGKKVLHLIRLVVVLKVGQAGLDAGISMGEAIKQLGRCVNNLADNLDEATRLYQEFSVQLKTDKTKEEGLLSLSEVLSKEITILRNLSSESNQQQTVYEAWQAIQGKNEKYAYFLRRVYTDLNEAIQTREEEEAKSAQTSKLKEEFTNKYNQLRNNLEKVCSEHTIIRRKQLQKELGEVHDAWGDYNCWEAANEDKAKYEGFVLKLENYLDHLGLAYDERGTLKDGDKLADALDILQELSEKPDWLITYSRNIAVNALKKLAEERGWPQQLYQAKKIVNVLSELSKTQEPSSREITILWEKSIYESKLKGVPEFSDGDTTINRLVEWDEKLQQWRKQLGWNNFENLGAWRERLINPDSKTMLPSGEGRGGEAADLTQTKGAIENDVLIGTPQGEGGDGAADLIQAQTNAVTENGGAVGISQEVGDGTDGSTNTGDEITNILQEAIEQKIEIVDWRTANSDYYSVQRLWEERQIRRLEKALTEAKDKIRKITDSLEKGEQLTLKEVESSHSRINSFTKSLEKLSGEIATGTTQLTELKTRLKNFVDLVKEIRQLVHLQENNDYSWATFWNEINGIIPSNNELAKFRQRIEGFNTPYKEFQTTVSRLDNETIASLLCLFDLSRDGDPKQDFCGVQVEQLKNKGDDWALFRLRENWPIWVNVSEDELKNKKDRANRLKKQFLTYEQAEYLRIWLKWCDDYEKGAKETQTIIETPNPQSLSNNTEIKKLEELVEYLRRLEKQVFPLTQKMAKELKRKVEAVANTMLKPDLKDKLEERKIYSVLWYMKLWISQKYELGDSQNDSLGSDGGHK